MARIQVRRLRGGGEVREEQRTHALDPLPSLREKVKMTWGCLLKGHGVSSSRVKFPASRVKFPHRLRVSL